jgi:hypothetical protein
LVIFVKSSNPRIAEKISHSIAGIWSGRGGVAEQHPLIYLCSRSGPGLPVEPAFWFFLDIILFIHIKNINIKMIHDQGWSNALLALPSVSWLRLKTLKLLRTTGLIVKKFGFS